MGRLIQLPIGKLPHPWVAQDDAASVLVAPAREHSRPVPLTQAETVRAEDVLMRAAKKALDKIAKGHKSGEFHHYSKLRRYAEAAFEKSVQRQCKMILDAARAKPSQHKASLDRVNDEIKEKRRAARKKLANELRGARQRLRTLQWEITRSEETVAAAVKDLAKKERKSWAVRLITARDRLQKLRVAHEQASLAWRAESRLDASVSCCLYPNVPLPLVVPTKEGFGLPSAPGIYFLWSGTVVEYVGQSVKLCERVRLGSHHVLRDDHMVSFLFFEKHELTWAECYYIGAVRPQLNFGSRAAHNKEEQHGEGVTP